ncbi:MAG: DUF748 domain-containing protein, partial [Candidatus Omnitrophica bacterium]|nr:DUF748 domain-containing protein [Candidatus Omnitrophota bacterium]
MKKILVSLLAILIFVLAIAYVFRFEIIGRSGESLIMRNLPPYVSVESVIFDVENGFLELKGFAVRNAPGYTEKHLVHADSLNCSFGLEGGNITEGIKVTQINAEGVKIYIEKNTFGRMNVNEMSGVLGQEEGTSEGKEGTRSTPGDRTAITDKAADFFSITDTVWIKRGQITFLDRTLPGGYRITFDDMEGKIKMDLTEHYTKVLSLASSGSGVVGGDPEQRIFWDMTLFPLSRDLTMSNRFRAENVQIRQFQPYYDPYSPVDILSGDFSGDLVLDFDNGNIGSMNTVKLRDFRFKAKQDSSSAGFWDVTVPDLLKYLSSSPGEIVFDFKIKGNMSKPEFYPGPIVR